MGSSGYISVAAAVFAVVLGAPDAARAADGARNDGSLDGTSNGESEDSEEVPLGFHKENQLRRWPLIAGTAAFVGAYGTSVGIGAYGGGYLQTLYVPVVGPFLAALQFKTGYIPADAFGDLLFALDGGIQAAGLVLVTYGLCAPHTVFVRNDARQVHVMPVPMVGRDGYGFGLVGKF